MYLHPHHRLATEYYMIFLLFNWTIVFFIFSISNHVHIYTLPKFTHACEEWNYFPGCIFLIPLGKVQNFENCTDSRLFDLFENAYEIMFQMLLKVQL